MTAPVPWRRCVLVSGHGRGGTTWVGDILKQSPTAVYLFEPLTITRHRPTAFSEQIRSLHRSRDYWMTEPSFVGARFEHYSQIIRGHVQELVGNELSPNVDTLVLKQPGIEWIPLLRAALQPQQIVYVARSPIAILNSYDRSNLHAGWRVREVFERCAREAVAAWPDMLTMLALAKGDPDLEVLAMICISQRIAERSSDGDRFFIESYEALAAGGPPAAQALAQRLRLGAPSIQLIEPLFSPEHAEVGFLDTRKKSAERVEAFVHELAPWKLRKGSAYLDAVGFKVPLASPGTIEGLRGTVEYFRRRARPWQSRLVAAPRKVVRVLGEKIAPGRHNESH